ncbi:MAG: SDR family NAD(P)-dependent oxidoreductase [Bacteroidia bacterium]|nr:SDR family NAD(P)-dependent oxidoreductase [Bacteroidia bacterium]
MTEKWILITGVSSGIGLDAARHLCSLNYNVIGTVRKLDDKKKLEAQLPDRFHCILLDVTNKNQIAEGIKEVDRILGGKKLDCLVNNAGIVKPGPLELIRDEDFEHQMDVNVSGVRNMTNACLPFMYQNDDKRKSKIIFISSVSGLFAAPFNGAYCISKHALECMVDIYRRELMIYKIDCIAIQPGPVKSKIWEKTIGTFEPYLNSQYGHIAHKADRIIQSSEKNALPVEFISKKIQKVIESAKPRTRYMVHTNKIGVKLLSGWIPDRIVDKMIWKNLNKKGTTKYRPV